MFSIRGMFTKRISEERSLSRIHGGFVLGLALIFYLAVISQFHAYNRTHGGGQPTLPGYDRIAAFLLYIGVLLMATYHLVSFRAIYQRARAGIPSIMIGLPLVVLVPFMLEQMDLPAGYYRFALVNLAVASLAHYFALRSRYVILILLAYAHSLWILSLCFTWWQLSAQRPMWWDKGHVIEYYRNGAKKAEYERRNEGVIFGNATHWNPDGTLQQFRRYPSGSGNTPDSSVDYRDDGSISDIEYNFDSAGAFYTRKIAYSYTGALSVYSTENIETHYKKTLDYNREYGWLEYYEYDFDSNGVHYERHLIYDSLRLKRVILEDLKTGKRYDSKYPNRRR